MRWNRNGEDAALIVKEYRAGRCVRDRFSEFVKGRREWLSRYKADTLEKNYCKTIDRYLKWLAGGTSLLSHVSCYGKVISLSPFL